MSQVEHPNLEQSAGPAPVARTVPLKIYGAVAEFESPHHLLTAIRAVQGQGYLKLDAYTPFAAHGIDAALEPKRSPLGYVVFAMGALGCAAALLLQWWTGAVSYPLVIAGKPLFAVEFSLPITFEVTVLFAAFGAVFGMFALNGLPRLYHPIFRYSRFSRVTTDAFLLAIEADAKDFDGAKAARVLTALGGKHAEVIAE
jgi:hypothetical protein